MRWLIVPPGPDTVLMYVDYSHRKLQLLLLYLMIQL